MTLMRTILSRTSSKRNPRVVSAIKIPRGSGVIRTSRRIGFTITELLASMALIVFIMSVLAESFSAGVETRNDLKAMGDMAERLRGASIHLREEMLAAGGHFEKFRDRALAGDVDPLAARALESEYRKIFRDARALYQEFGAVQPPTRE